MRVQKAIGTKELEVETRNGWQLIATLKQVAPIEISRRQPTDAERSRGAYGEIVEHGSGERLVFIVEKEVDALTREAELVKARDNTSIKVHDLEIEIKNLKADKQQLASNLEAIDKRRASAVVDRDRADALAHELRAKVRAYEADIAKLRTAFGEVKMKEILGR